MIEKKVFVPLVRLGPPSDSRPNTDFCSLMVSTTKPQSGRVGVLVVKTIERTKGTNMRPCKQRKAMAVMFFSARVDVRTESFLLPPQKGRRAARIVPDLARHYWREISGHPHLFRRNVCICKPRADLLVESQSRKHGISIGGSTRPLMAIQARSKMKRDRLVTDNQKLDGNNTDDTIC